MTHSKLIGRIGNELKEEEDQISQLPDEILVHVLSLLTTDEAVQTSFLSHRWKNLWKSTSCLNFHASGAIARIDDTAWRAKHVAWVNRVLTLHESSCVDEFKIRLHLDGTDSFDIDNWIKSILCKRVKSIDIDLLAPPKQHDNPYSLSHNSHRHFRSATNINNIKYLTSLSLAFVSVSEELLEYLLSNCPRLESLSLVCSAHISNLKVGSSAVGLKYLKIIRCSPLKSIELSAPKLTKFEYFRKKVKFHIGDNPLLAELNLAGSLGDDVIDDVLVQFSSTLPQLKTLSLELGFGFEKLMTPRVPELKYLKHLKLRVGICYEGRLVILTSLVLACPLLETFTFILDNLLLQEIPCDRLSSEPSIEIHRCLKQVEIQGYSGGCSEFELAMYLSKIAVSLDKMVIHPCSLSKFEKEELMKTRQVKMHMDLEEIKKSLPPTVKFILL